MHSLGLIVCGLLSFPGADPVDLGHDIDPTLIRPSGGFNDPYGIYRHLTQPQSSPYHTIRHDQPRTVAVTVPRHAPATPYYLVRHPEPTASNEMIASRPTFEPEQEAEKEPEATTEMTKEPVAITVMTKEPVVTTEMTIVASGLGDVIACGATLQGTTGAIVRAEYVLPSEGEQGSEISVADYRIPAEESPKPAIRLISVQPLYPAEPTTIVTDEIRKEVLFPIPEWAEHTSPFESALDQRQRSRR